MKNKQIRVLLLSDQFPPDVGGGGSLVYYLALGLADAGCQVTVVSSKHDRQLEAERIDAFLRKRKVTVDRIKSHFSLGRLELEGAVQSVTRIARERHVNVIHAHHFGAIYVGSVAGNALGIPLVASSHKTPIPKWVPGLERRQAIYSVAKHTTDLNAKAWIAYSRAFESELKKMNPKTRPFLIYPGIAMPVFGRNRFPPHDRTIIVPSRLDRRKGLERVIAAVSDYNRRSKQKLLVIFTGEPDTRKERLYKKELEDEAHRRRVQVSFKRHDFLDLPSAYWGKFACVLPSDREGLGLVLLESMSQGTPVVVAEAIGTSEVVKDRRNGLVFSKDVEGDLSEVLTSLADDPKLRKTIVEGGYKTVQGQFLNERSAKEHIFVYSQVIGHSKQRS
jgi:glycosyltransferase involved in cell wall biosynthesis